MTAEPEATTSDPSDERGEALGERIEAEKAADLDRLRAMAEGLHYAASRDNDRFCAREMHGDASAIDRLCAEVEALRLLVARPASPPPEAQLSAVKVLSDEWRSAADAFLEEAALAGSEGNIRRMEWWRGSAQAHKVLADALVAVVEGSSVPGREKP